MALFIDTLNGKAIIMARPYFTADGTARLSYTLDGTRKTAVLGKHVSDISLEKYSRMILETVRCRRENRRISDDLLQDLNSLPEKLKRSIRKQGLFDFGVREHVKLSELFDEFLTLPHTESVSAVLERSRRNFEQYFDMDRNADTLEVSELLDFVRYLSTRPYRPLNSVSIENNWKRWRAVFRYALNRGVVKNNVFMAFKAGGDADRTESVYVERSMIRELIEKCTKTETRNVLSFARFAGLRIPSEVKVLRWQDFSGNRFVIPGGKTGGRIVPLFADLKPELERLRAVSGTGEYLFPKLRGKSQGYASDCVRYLLTVLKTDSWPKLFNSLRASCITDYIQAGVPNDTLDAIFGNTRRIRSTFYSKMRETDYNRVLAIQFE